MKNYLVLGVNGMAGHMIALYLAEQGRNVIGFGRRPSSICQTIVGDALIENDIDKALAKYDYDVVINAIGILNTDVDHNMEEGFYINAELPHMLAQKLKTKRTKLIHISTDCVFAGDRSWYTEKDMPDATSQYGISKMQGEVIDNTNLTIRTSIIGPELKKDGIGLFHWFMSQKKEVYGYKNAIWSGLTTLQLAKFILEDEIHNITGLFHLSNGEAISKYDLLMLLNKYCREDKIRIKENTQVKINRSIDTVRKDIIIETKSYPQMIIEMQEWIEKHSDIYDN